MMINSSNMSNRPFLISRKEKTIVPIESEGYDPRGERLASIMMVTNSFIMIALIYDSLKQILFLFTPEGCPRSYYLLIGNVFYLLTSFYGLNIVKKKNSNMVKFYLLALFFVLISRVFIYAELVNKIDIYEFIPYSDTSSNNTTVITNTTNHTVITNTTNHTVIINTTNHTIITNSLVYHIFNNQIIPHNNTTSSNNTSSDNKNTNSSSIPSNYIPSEVKQEALKQFCKTQQGMYILQGIVESVILLVLLILGLNVFKYIRAYERLN